MSIDEYSSLKPEQQLGLLTRAANDALTHWDMAGADIDLIKFRENAVFDVKLNDRRVALRVHRLGYHSDDALRSELQWMSALNEVGIETPVVVPSIDNGMFVRQPLNGLDAAVQIDVFEWIDGEQLGSVEEGLNDPEKITEAYFTIGALAAKVHNQSSRWELPENFNRHAWDAAGLAGDQPFWNKFWELKAASEEQREFLLRAKERVFDALDALPKTPDIYSMIHADLVTENVMVTANGIKLIDFDDAGFGWHLFELATVLYFLLDEPWYEQAKNALIDGYRSERRLSDEQLALLPLFLCARGFTYLGWVHTRPETETARELTPMLLDLACRTAKNSLNI